MADLNETSYDSSESEFMERSLSVWLGSCTPFENDDFIADSVDLHTAASLGQYDCVRSFLNSKDTDPDRKNRGGWTPLMYASYIGHDNIIHLLLDVRVNVDARNPKGQTSLMLASCCGNESIAYFLLNAGADLEARDEIGWTALFHATYSGHQNVVKFLLENGANMKAREPSRGMTPFMQASLEGHEIIVQYFLQHGVDVDEKAYSGDTARSMALFVGHTKVVSLIDNAAVAMQAGALRKRSTMVHGDYIPNRRKQSGPSILDGPVAFAKIMDKAPSSGGDGNCNKGTNSPEMTSPVIVKDHRLNGSWGSSHASSEADDEEDEPYVFNHTGALTIKSSSGSSTSLAAALGVVEPDLNLAERIADFADPVSEPCLPSGLFSGLPSANGLHDFPDTLEALLQQLGLPKYLSTFVEQDVDLQVFLSLTDNDLKEVGITLFGPRRKMTNAIARWHSNMSITRNTLEQAYADRLEAEMQELAIQLHKACDQLDKMKAEVLQERELRSVAEACLMEAWQPVRRLATDTKQQCATVHELTRRSRFCLRELSQRQTTTSVDTITSGLYERLHIEAPGANDVTLMSNDAVLRLMDHMMEKIAICAVDVNTNTDKLLGKEVNFQDSFGRVT